VYFIHFLIDFRLNIKHFVYCIQQNEVINMSARSLTKPAFGVPSLETATRIDDSDAANAACAAHFRFATRMRELEAQFEGKASELRAAFLAELAEIREAEEA
jgi:hypothetical protein